MAKGNFIAYYRVSTPKQGVSGLGLEAQRTAVNDYLNGGRWKLVAELTEVESGKKNGRPQLAKALALCRLHNATLIIAKLDRLARNVAPHSAGTRGVSPILVGDALADRPHTTRECATRRMIEAMRAVRQAAVCSARRCAWPSGTAEAARAGQAARRPSP